jgi:hypothetical protein
MSSLLNDRCARIFLSALCLLTLAAFVGCATDGTVAATPSKPAPITPPTTQNIPLRGNTAEQIYQILFTVKTNSMAAASLNLYPPAKLPDNCQAFLNALTNISADMEFRLEFEPFVQNLFLVDATHRGAAYGSLTNKIYLFNAGTLITDTNSQGAAWVIPLGQKGEKAFFIHTSIGPQRTSIMLFDDPLDGHLIYDSFASPGDDKIDYLCGIEVTSRDHFNLHEARLFNLPLGMIPPRQLWPRTFKLSVNENFDVNLEQ